MRGKEDLVIQDLLQIWTGKPLIQRIFAMIQEVIMDQFQQIGALREIILEE